MLNGNVMLLECVSEHRQGGGMIDCTLMLAKAERKSSKRVN